MATNKKYSFISRVLTMTTTMFSMVWASWFWVYQPKTPKCMKK